MITLEYGGTEQSLADWGFSLGSAQLALRNLAASTFSVVRLGDTISTAAVFPYRGKIVLRSGRTGSGTTWASGQVDFIGYRMIQMVSSSGENFGVRYTFADAWHFLESTPYQQFYASRNVDGSVLAYKAVPELMLFTCLDGGNALQQYNSGEQIGAVLQFVIDAFSAQSMAQPFIIGTIDPALELPSNQKRQMMCAAVIKSCLELSPDVNLVVDYTTTVGASVPTPTLHFRARASQTPVSLALHNGTDHSSIRIESRDDLQPRAVVIWYKITGNDTGQDWVVYLFDKYGPNGQSHASDPQYGLDVLTQFIDLQGSQTTTVSAVVEVETVNASHATDATRIAWWQDRVPKLKSDKVDQDAITISVASVAVVEARTPYATVLLATYPNELTKGPLPSWTGKTVKKVKITAKASYNIYKDAAAAGNTPPGSPVAALLVKAHVDEVISCIIEVTDATSTTYSTLAESIPGETVPGLVSIAAGVGTFADGLAKDIYTSLATLQYEGEDVRVEAEPTAQVTFANVLNLTGGLTAWATMNAQLQSITRHYGTGHTTVSFGPPAHNSAGQMFELMQYSRPRFVWYNPALRETGSYATGGGNVDAGGATPAENGGAGGGYASESYVYGAA